MQDASHFIVYWYVVECMILHCHLITLVYNNHYTISFYQFIYNVHLLYNSTIIQIMFSIILLAVIATDMMLFHFSETRFSSLRQLFCNCQCWILIRKLNQICKIWFPKFHLPQVQRFPVSSINYTCLITFFLLRSTQGFLLNKKTLKHITLSLLRWNSQNSKEFDLMLL